MRTLLFGLTWIPSLALAANNNPPLSLHTQLELLLFPLGVLLFTLALVFWHRRKRN